MTQPLTWLNPHLYSSPLPESKDLLSDWLRLCGAGSFAEAARQFQCIDRAQYPFYNSRGLDWGKQESIRQGLDVCTKVEFNPDAASVLATCVAQTWSADAAMKAECTKAIPVIVKSPSDFKDCLAYDLKDCLKEIKKHVRVM